MRVVTSKDSDGFSRGYWCDVCDRVLADMDVHYDDTFGYGEVFDNERDDWQKVAAAMKGESDG
ncbi:MAG TPA: hypothetical protein VMW52_04115 [Phycisphaerae bacterium]|nr:hypothetical protein [Phycisphaerae bacterium]